MVPATMKYAVGSIEIISFGSRVGGENTNAQKVTILFAGAVSVAQPKADSLNAKGGTWSEGVAQSEFRELIGELEISTRQYARQRTAEADFTHKRAPKGSVFLRGYGSHE